jgi:hypothetical protein
MSEMSCNVCGVRYAVEGFTRQYCHNKDPCAVMGYSVCSL